MDGILQHVCWGRGDLYLSFGIWRCPSVLLVVHAFSRLSQHVTVSRHSYPLGSLFLHLTFTVENSLKPMGPTVAPVGNKWKRCVLLFAGTGCETRPPLPQHTRGMSPWKGLCRTSVAFILPGVVPFGFSFRPCPTSLPGWSLLTRASRASSPFPVQEPE